MGDRAMSDRRTFLSQAATLTGGLALGAQPTAQRRRFENKVVLITGATSGIGRAAAIMFAAEGAKVAFCGRREQRGHEVEATIANAGGQAIYVKADVLVETQVAALVDRTIKQWGRIDVAFNNAGITIEKPLHELTAEEFDRVVGTDLRGVFLAMKYELPHMIAGGGGT